MSRRRFDNLDENKQRKLIAVAAEEFAAKGYDGASLNRILERAGMSKSSLYYYFEDKADLFTTLIERLTADLLRQVGPLDLAGLDKEGFWDACERAYARLAEAAAHETRLMLLGRLFYRLRADPSHNAATQRLFDAARGWLEALLARGQEIGAVRSDQPLSFLAECALGLGEALDRWILTHWESIDEDARRKTPAAHIELFRRLLRP